MRPWPILITQHSVHSETGGLKRKKLQGESLTRDGTWAPIELAGLAGFDALIECPELGMVLYVGLKLVPYGKPTRYRTKMEKYDRKDDKGLYPLIYQTRAHVRTEQCIIIKRQLAAKAREESRRSVVPHHDPPAPWNDIWIELLDNPDRFWREEPEEPALIIKTKAGASGTVIGEDAPVGTTSQHTGSSGSVHGTVPPPPPPHVAGRVRPARPAATAGANKGKAHAVEVFPDGKERCTLNRYGHSFCPGWVAGTCTASINQTWRAVNEGKVHQCGKCLQPGHNLARCLHKEQQEGGVWQGRGVPAAPQVCNYTPKGAGKGWGKGKAKNTWQPKGWGKGKRWCETEQLAETPTDSSESVGTVKPAAAHNVPNAASNTSPAPVWGRGDSPTGPRPSRDSSRQEGTN